MMDVNKVYIGLIHLISNEKKLLLKKHIKLGITPNANMNELKINFHFASLEFLRKLGINNISTNAINEYKDNAILISRPMLLVEYPNSNARINVINKISPDRVVPARRTAKFPSCMSGRKQAPRPRTPPTGSYSGER